MTAAASLQELTRRFTAQEAAPPAERGATYLHPGQVVAPATPHVVTTILGSCVAVCLHDSAKRVGGINHYLLPGGSGSPREVNPRFGDHALQLLLRRVLALGCRRETLQAKVFGGACVLEAFQRADQEHLGTRNVETALDFLRAEGIPVAGQDTGGQRGRKLLFHTDSGTALLKLI